MSAAGVGAGGGDTSSTTRERSGSVVAACPARGTMHVCARQRGAVGSRGSGTDTCARARRPSDPQIENIAGECDRCQEGTSVGSSPDLAFLENGDYVVLRGCLVVKVRWLDRFAQKLAEKSVSFENDRAYFFMPGVRLEKGSLFAIVADRVAAQLQELFLGLRETSL